MTTNKTSLSRLTKVRHRNELNSTLSTLPMAAKKVLFLAMCQINSKNEFDDDHIFYVTVADYIKWVQVKPDAAYLALRDGSNILDVLLSVVRLTSVNAASLYQLIRKIYSNNSR
ncbi:RepB family plasmid replication initiator protein, partial [Shigella sonnei]|uniref:RepB family plasmid replication initiator protein n=1 Tax=Shigella sonnei TaxID=624 RepID=UPI00339010C0